MIKGYKLGNSELQTRDCTNNFNSIVILILKSKMSMSMPTKETPMYTYTIQIAITSQQAVELNLLEFRVVASENDLYP